MTRGSRGESLPAFSIHTTKIPARIVGTAIRAHTYHATCGLRGDEVMMRTPISHPIPISFFISDKSTKLPVSIALGWIPMPHVGQTETTMKLVGICRPTRYLVLFSQNHSLSSLFQVSGENKNEKEKPWTSRIGFPLPVRRLPRLRRKSAGCIGSSSHHILMERCFFFAPSFFSFLILSPITPAVFVYRCVALI